MNAKTLVLHQEHLIRSIVLECLAVSPSDLTSTARRRQHFVRLQLALVNKAFAQACKHIGERRVCLTLSLDEQNTRYAQYPRASRKAKELRVEVRSLPCDNATLINAQVGDENAVGLQRDATYRRQLKAITKLQDLASFSLIAASDTASHSQCGGIAMFILWQAMPSFFGAMTSLFIDVPVLVEPMNLLTLCSGALKHFGLCADIMHRRHFDAHGKPPIFQLRSIAVSRLSLSWRETLRWILSTAEPDCIVTASLAPWTEDEMGTTLERLENLVVLTSPSRDSLASSSWPHLKRLSCVYGDVFSIARNLHRMPKLESLRIGYPMQRSPLNAVDAQVRRLREAEMRPGLQLEMCGWENWDQSDPASGIAKVAKACADMGVKLEWHEPHSPPLLPDPIPSSERIFHQLSLRELQGEVDAYDLWSRMISIETERAAQV